MIKLRRITLALILAVPLALGACGAPAEPIALQVVIKFEGTPPYPNNALATQGGVGTSCFVPTDGFLRASPTDKNYFMLEGTQAQLTDADTGKILSLSKVPIGSVTSEKDLPQGREYTCQWKFAFDKVPLESAFYNMSIGDESFPKFTASDFEPDNKIEFTITN